MLNSQINMFAEALKREDFLAIQRSQFADLDMTALCPDSIEAFRECFASSNPKHAWLKLTPEEFLLRLNVAWQNSCTEEYHPTASGLLMFGYAFAIEQYFPHFLLDYRIYSPSNKIKERVVSNDGTWSGNVFDFWRRVSAHVEAVINERAELTQEQRSQIAHAAHEGLINSLVHADYFLDCRVLVSLYQDRIEFTNPTTMHVSLIQGLSDSSLFQENPRLMKMFTLIDASQGAGTGIPLMMESCEQAGVAQPVFMHNAKPERVSLSLSLLDGKHQAAKKKASAPTKATQPEGLLDDTADKVDVALAHIDDADSRKVVNLFRSSKRIRRADVESLLGIGSTKAKAMMTALVSEGILLVEGGGRSTYYKLA